MTSSPADCEKCCGATSTPVSTEATKPCNGVATTELSWRDVTDSPPRSRRPGPSRPTSSQSAVAGLRKVENQRSSSGPRNTVRRTVSEATASGVTPVGDGVSSRARVPPVLRRSQPSSDQRTCCTCGLPAEGAPVVGADRARAEVGDVPLAVRGAHQRAVTGLLQPGVRVEPGGLEVVRVVATGDVGRVAGQEGVEGVGFVRPLDDRRPGQGDAVRVPGAALGRHEVVLPVVPVQVGGLQAAPVRATPVDAAGLADQSPQVRVVLVEDDRPGVLVPGAGVPLQGHQPVPAVVVVEERRVEARRC